MATSPAVADGASFPAPAHKMSLVKMILAILVAVLLAIGGVGGGLYYLMKSGRVPMAKGAVIVETKAAPVAPTTPTASHTLSLESVVANLADASGPAYLKMGLSLKIADEPVKKGEKAKEEKAPKGMSDEEAGVRDTVLMVLGHQNAAGLLEVDGKERLKAELKTALAEHNPELKVMEVHFTDFLVQR